MKNPPTIRRKSVWNKWAITLLVKLHFEPWRRRIWMIENAKLNCQVQQRFSQMIDAKSLAIMSSTWRNGQETRTSEFCAQRKELPRYLLSETAAIEHWSVKAVVPSFVMSEWLIELTRCSLSDLSLYLWNPHWSPWSDRFVQRISSYQDSTVVLLSQLQSGLQEQTLSPNLFNEDWRNSSWILSGNLGGN